MLRQRRNFITYTISILCHVPTTTIQRNMSEGKGKGIRIVVVVLVCPTSLPVPSWVAWVTGGHFGVVAAVFFYLFVREEFC